MKYWRNISGIMNLNRHLGASISISDEYFSRFGKIISSLNYGQKLIIETVYIAHQDEVYRAAAMLKKINSANGRLKFLESNNNINDDVELSVVFRYAKTLFLEVYELRNALSHEVWFSSNAFEGSLLLAILNEEAKLLMTSGRMKHGSAIDSKEIFEGIVNFINHVKLINLSDMIAAQHDIDLCNFCLMKLQFILEVSDPYEIEKMKESFYVFNGTSHLFPHKVPSRSVVTWESHFNKEIPG